MNDHREGSSRPRRYARYAVLSLAAVVVLSLGFSLIPAEPPAPPEPPFSERARATALAEALALRTAGLQLAAGGAGAGPALEPIVTLLTIQARALLPAVPPTPPAAPSGPPAPAAPPSAAAQDTVQEFARALSGSAHDRLEDAERSDGGMARLLAGAGMAQLLAAEQLAATIGSPEVLVQEEAATPSASAASEPAAGGNGVPAPCPASLPAAGAGAALAAAAAMERETIYGYQAALPRLDAGRAGPASEFLTAHQDMAREAEALSRRECAASVPREPGYVLPAGFLEAPVAGVARLEAATLASYGDVVALTEGGNRAWALSALQAAARRTVYWGADPGPVPGLALDEAQLPQLPG